MSRTTVLFLFTLIMVSVACPSGGTTTQALYAVNATTKIGITVAPLPSSWRQVGEEEARRNAPPIPGVIKTTAFASKLLRAGVFPAAYDGQTYATANDVAKMVRRHIQKEGFQVSNILISADGERAEFAWYKRIGIVPMSGRFCVWLPPVAKKVFVAMCGAWFIDNDRQAALDFYAMITRTKVRLI